MDITALESKFHKLFTNNHTKKNIEVDIQIKQGAKRQTTYPNPFTTTCSRKRNRKIKKQKHIQKAKIHRRKLFCKPPSSHNKKNKSVKIALHSRKLNEITVKRKTQMPNMEELISRISKKIADGPVDETCISNFDLDYAYGQLQFSNRAMDLYIFAVTGGNFTGYYCFLKSFYGLADIPTIFQEKKDQTLENKHPSCLDDIIVVSKSSKQKHINELVDVLTKLENASYRLSESKFQLLKTDIELISHKIDQKGIRPLQDKLLAIKELKKPGNEKERKSFSGTIQYLSEYVENLSAQTDSLRQILKKDTERNRIDKTPKRSRI